MTAEVTVRLVSFLAIFATVVAAERLSPRRSAPVKDRWFTNLGLTALNAAILRALPSYTAYAAALSAEGLHAGLFRWLELPPSVQVVLSLVILDLAIYFQHRLFHAVPALWNLHKVHHADTAIDATTGLRFHPAEIILSMAIKAGIVWIIGASPIAVVIFEVILNGCSVFNHGNFRWPDWLERPVRALLVTPDMHRIHHSKDHLEMNSNFGFSVPWWDRLCGTYRKEPGNGQIGMEIGLSGYPAPLSLLQAIELPFRAGYRR